MHTRSQLHRSSSYSLVSELTSTDGPPEEVREIEARERETSGRERNWKYEKGIELRWIIGMCDHDEKNEARTHV